MLTSKMKLFGTLCLCLLHISPCTAWCLFRCPQKPVNPEVVLPFTLTDGDEVDVYFTQDKFDSFLGYICDNEVKRCTVKLNDDQTVRKFEIDYGAQNNLKTWCSTVVKDFWDAIFGPKYPEMEMKRCQHDNYWTRVNERCETISRNDNGCNNAEVSVPLGASRRLKVADDAQICTVCKKGDDCYNYSGVTSQGFTDGGIGMEVVSSTTTVRPSETIQDSTTESTVSVSPGNAANGGEDVQIPIILGVAIAGGILLLIVVILIIGVILWRRRRSQEDQQEPADDVSTQEPSENGIYFVNPKNEMVEAEYEHLSYPTYCQQK